MTTKQLDRIEARGVKLTARMKAIEAKCIAEGRDHGTDAEIREVEKLAAEVRSLTAKLEVLTGKHTR